MDRVAFSSAQVGQFERFILHENNGDTVGVLAVTADGKIPFVEQYRIPTHRWTLEIPAGHANAPSEQYLDVASRKLREEAGYEASKLTQFTRFINTPRLLLAVHRAVSGDGTQGGGPFRDRPGDATFRGTPVHATGGHGDGDQRHHR